MKKVNFSSLKNEIEGIFSQKKNARVTLRFLPKRLPNNIKHDIL